MTTKTEEAVTPVVVDFVATLGGRFRDHCSDRMLQVLLLHRLSMPHFSGKPDESRADLLLKGDANAGYAAAVTVFEGYLEGGCGARLNGHHVAQDFQAACNLAFASLVPL